MTIGSGNPEDQGSDEQVEDTLFANIVEETLEEILGVEGEDEQTEEDETTTEDLETEEDGEEEAAPKVELDDAEINRRSEQSFKDKYYGLLETQKASTQQEVTPAATQNSDPISDAMHTEGYVTKIKQMVDEADLTEAAGNMMLQNEYNHRKEMAMVKESFGGIQSTIMNSQGLTKAQTLTEEFTSFGIEKGSPEEAEALNLLKEDFKVDMSNPSVLANIDDKQIQKLARYVSAAVSQNNARRNPNGKIVPKGKKKRVSSSKPVVQKKQQQEGKSLSVTEIIQRAREGKSY